MRILGWSIDAFGPLESVAVRELPEGLTVFYGPDEAVKTTLLTFLRGGLFGFDPQRNGRGYDPDGCGRLFVTGATGQLTLERYADPEAAPRILLPDGSEGTIADLDNLLGVVDASLFDSIFALQQRDVQALSNLDGRGLCDRLISIPAIGAGKRARGVASQLGDRAAELLAPGEEASIGMMVARIQSLRLRLDAARRLASSYRDLRQAADETAADVVRLRRALESSVAEQHRCATLLKLGPTYRALERATRSLQALEPTGDLPADAETRLTLAAARAAAATSALQNLREQQSKDLHERRGSEPLAALESVTDSVEDLYAESNRHRERLGDLTHARVRCERAKRAADEKAQQLGVGWNAERLASFDVLRPISEEARAWQRRLSHAAEDEQRARQALADATARRDDYQRRRAAWSERQRSAPSVDPAPPLDVRLATARLSNNLAAVPAGRMRAEVRDRIVEERERLLRTVELGRAAALPGWSRMVPWLALIGAAVATVERGVRGDWRSVLVIELAAAIAVATTYLWRKVRQRASQDARQRLEELTLREDLEDAQRERDAYWLSNVALQQVIAHDSATLGLGNPPASGESIPALPRTTARRNADPLVPSANQPIRDELTEACDQAEREIHLFTQRLADMRALASRMDAEWTAWKAGQGLPARLSPEGVSDFLAELREAQLALVARDKAEETLREIEDTIAKWELRARTNLARAAMPVGDDVGGEALIEELTLLRNRCARAAQERSSLMDLDRAIEERASKISAAEAEIRRLEEDRIALLRASGCADESDFRHKQRVFEERSELQRMVREHETRLATIAADDKLDELLADLAAGTEDEWQRVASEAEGRIQQTRASLQIAEERDLQAAEACRVVEESDEIATLEGQCAEALAELSDAVHRWRVFAVALGLVEDSIREVEQVRVPAVLAAASAALSTITHGQYQQIQSDGRGTGLLVVDQQGQVQPVDGYSPAAALPLYLSARLGLVANFTQRNTRMPLIIDDILVGLDRDLARGITAALGKAAEESQVLFFTCDPETCLLLADSGKAARVVQI
jgi:uncharacterized protein YhaN